jgi:hypothetical protein
MLIIVQHDGAMITTECKSVYNAAETAMSIAIEWGDKQNDPTIDVWYRGVNDGGYDLLPSSYWKKDVDETSSLNIFKQLVRNVADTRGFNDWDYYCLARHHGIPTRLIDWTEGFFQALFFAFDNWSGDTSPCIWMLRPDALNKHSVGEDSIFVTGGEGTSMWLPPIESQAKDIEGATWTNKNPIAIHPPRSNPRVIGQLGTFTVHGVDKTPLNRLLASAGNSDKFLAKIHLVDFDSNKVKRLFFYLGLRQSVIYPDPDHIARDVGYMYGWLD